MYIYRLQQLGPPLNAKHSFSAEENDDAKWSDHSCVTASWYICIVVIGCCDIPSALCNDVMSKFSLNIDVGCMDLWPLVCYLNDDDDGSRNTRFKTNNIYVEEEESNVHTTRLYMGGGWIERLFVKCTIWLIDMTQLTLVVIQRVSILKHVRLHCMLCLCLYFAGGSLLALMETIITLTHTYNDLITIRRN